MVYLMDESSYAPLRLLEVWDLREDSVEVAEEGIIKTV
jgi:hypothetical protein